MAGVIVPHADEKCACGARLGHTFRGEPVCMNPDDHARNLAIAAGKLCAAEMVDEGYAYHCNRKQPHTTLHASLGPDGEPLAV